MFLKPENITDIKHKKTAMNDCVMKASPLTGQTICRDMLDQAQDSESRSTLLADHTTLLDSSD